MINLPQFIEHVIRPTLIRLDFGDGRNVEELLLGTAIQESRLQYLHQLGGGPAQGVFQMEPITHNDIWTNYLAYRQHLAIRINSLSVNNVDGISQMEANMYYACAMARVHYRRVPGPIPDQGDLDGQADYWKKHYNTYLGAGTVEEYIEHYQEATFKLEWP